MKLREIINSIEFQGNMIIKQWDNEKETYNILIETDIAIFRPNILDMKVLYMYASGNNLTIEVE